MMKKQMKRTCHLQRKLRLFDENVKKLSVSWLEIPCTIRLFQIPYILNQDIRYLK